jgi:DNA-binding GntR family transcriptional regulator
VVSDRAAGEGADGGPRDRGFRERKREDHALVLIEELRRHLDDLSRVRRILLELGRFYDPILGGAIMTVAHQQAVVGALERGDRAAAERLIQARYDLYIRDRVHLGRRGEDAG